MSRLKDRVGKRKTPVKKKPDRTAQRAAVLLVHEKAHKWDAMLKEREGGNAFLADPARLIGWDVEISVSFHGSLTMRGVVEEIVDGWKAGEVVMDAKTVAGSVAIESKPGPATRCRNIGIRLTGEGVAFNGGEVLFFKLLADGSFANENPAIQARWL